jgi:hypothetical protein
VNLGSKLGGIWILTITVLVSPKVYKNTFRRFFIQVWKLQTKNRQSPTWILQKILRFETFVMVCFQGRKKKVISDKLVTGTKMILILALKDLRRYVAAVYYSFWCDENVWPEMMNQNKNEHTIHNRFSNVEWHFDSMTII